MPAADAMIADENAGALMEAKEFAASSLEMFSSNAEPMEFSPESFDRVFEYLLSSEATFTEANKWVVVLSAADPAASGELLHCKLFVRLLIKELNSVSDADNAAVEAEKHQSSCLYTLLNLVEEHFEALLSNMTKNADEYYELMAVIAKDLAQCASPTLQDLRLGILLRMFAAIKVRIPALQDKVHSLLPNAVQQIMKHEAPLALVQKGNCREILNAINADNQNIVVFSFSDFAHCISEDETIHAGKQGYVDVCKRSLFIYQSDFDEYLQISYSSLKDVRFEPSNKPTTTVVLTVDTLPDDIVGFHEPIPKDEKTSFDFTLCMVSSDAEKFKSTLQDRLMQIESAADTSNTHPRKVSVVSSKKNTPAPTTLKFTSKSSVQEGDKVMMLMEQKSSFAEVWVLLEEEGWRKTEGGNAGHDDDNSISPVRYVVPVVPVKDAVIGHTMFDSEKDVLRFVRNNRRSTLTMTSKKGKTHVTYTKETESCEYVTSPDDTPDKPEKIKPSSRAVANGKDTAIDRRASARTSNGGAPNMEGSSTEPKAKEVGAPKRKKPTPSSHAGNTDASLAHAEEEEAVSSHSFDAQPPSSSSSASSSAPAQSSKSTTKKTPQVSSAAAKETSVSTSKARMRKEQPEQAKEDDREEQDKSKRHKTEARKKQPEESEVQEVKAARPKSTRKEQKEPEREPAAEDEEQQLVKKQKTTNLRSSTKSNLATSSSAEAPTTSSKKAPASVMDENAPNVTVPIPASSPVPASKKQGTKRKAAATKPERDEDEGDDDDEEQQRKLVPPERNLYDLSQADGSPNNIFEGEPENIMMQQGDSFLDSSNVDSGYPSNSPDDDEGTGSYFEVALQKILQIEQEQEHRKFLRSVHTATEACQVQINGYLGQWVQLHQSDYDNKEILVGAKFDSYVEMASSLNSSMSIELSYYTKMIDDLSHECNELNEKNSQLKIEGHDLFQQLKEDDKNFSKDLNSAKGDLLTSAKKNLNKGGRGGGLGSR